MQVSAAGARSRRLASLLVQYLRTAHNELYVAILAREVLDAITADDSITLTILDGDAPGDCSVAGTCDVERRIITVSRASAGRMRYSALHELGHLLMAEGDDYQDAYVDAARSVPNRARLIEDVCEAFAAALLLPDSDTQMASSGVSLNARGLRDLANQLDASREACAVWVSQHMVAPGYALICHGDGSLQFAARSGDAIPLTRGASQVGSALQPLFADSRSFRGRGRLRFKTGAFGEELYIDAVRDGHLVFSVATTDSPDWPVLHQPVNQPAVDALEGWCEDCAASFRTYRACSDCGAPIHDECGSCDCAPNTDSSRICSKCFLECHRSQFDGSSTICRECSS